jgi:hypothetical protein
MSAAKSGAGVSFIPGFRFAHPGYETAGVICPTGYFARGVSSPFSKNISVLQNAKSPYMSTVPPHQGALANVINAGRDAVDAEVTQDESD